MPTPLSNPGSTADNPDLNWSQVRETISMLCLAMAQVETSLNDSSKSVDVLTQTFTEIANDAQSLIKNLSEAESGDDLLAAKANMQEKANSVLSKMTHAVVAFQFYDRLSQKLGHVNESLTHLGDVIGDPGRVFNPTEWSKIQSEIRTNYTMECERLMFDLIMKGATIPEALELYRHEFDLLDISNDDTEDDIELF
ncbi:MAG: hypothetical protein MI976_08230 [Pseudomonadales bacterium]|nr:hypothetical protein [Pseudomonadales bacterium]